MGAMKGSFRQSLVRSAVALLSLAAALGLVQAARIGTQSFQNKGLLSDLLKIRAEARRDGAELSVLCVGSSHTQSLSQIPGYSFPDQLETLLRQRRLGAPIEVKNAGKSGAPAQKVLKILEAELEGRSPTWVVIMIGELEDWRKDPEVEDLPMPDGWAYVPGGESRYFKHVALRDVSTLATKWAGLLSKADDWARLVGRPQLVEEAGGALAAWKPDGTGDSVRTIYGVKALFFARYRSTDEAEAAIGELLAAAGSDYDLLAGLALEEVGKKETGHRSPRLRELERELARRKPDPRALALARYVFERSAVPPAEDTEERKALLKKAIRMAPGQSPLLAELSTLLLDPKITPNLSSQEESENVARMNKGYWENPFEPGRLTIMHLKAFGRAEPDFLAHYNRRFPSVAISEDEIEPAEAQERIRSQLHEAVRMVRAKGARPILQTYPPHRGTGEERKADALIREVAAAEQVPLADLFAEIQKRAATETLAAFFDRAGELVQDDHMNKKGNGVAAEQLAAIIAP